MIAPLLERLRVPCATADSKMAAAEIEVLRASLTEIADMPFSMVNDADSLRHTIRVMQGIARKSLKSE